MDPAYKETDKILARMEKRIAKEYKQAEQEIQKKLETYLERSSARDEKKRAALDAGKITKEEYNHWKEGQLIAGRRWTELRDTISEDYHNANQIAKSVVNGYMPEVYALNHNYGTYEVEKGARLDTSYTLYNHQAVERILRENPEMLPPPGKRTSERIAAGLEKRWNNQQIQSVMVQGILQGESMPQLAKRLAEKVGDKNKASAIRNARTMTTRAQNYGRLDSYNRAEKLGIILKKKWVATLDHVTRDSHVDVDGEVVGIHETFSNDLDCPGGMGPPEEVYNCRCAMVTEFEGFDHDVIRANEEKGIVKENPELAEMSFKEWEKRHSQKQLKNSLRPRAT